MLTNAPPIYDVLINDLPIAEAIMNVAPGLDLIPPTWVCATSKSR